MILLIIQINNAKNMFIMSREVQMIILILRSIPVLFQERINGERFIKNQCDNPKNNHRKDNILIIPARARLCFIYRDCGGIGKTVVRITPVL